jgi:hypothetical protein
MHSLLPRSRQQNAVSFILQGEEYVKFATSHITGFLKF